MNHKDWHIAIAACSANHEALDALSRLVNAHCDLGISAVNLRIRAARAEAEVARLKTELAAKEVAHG